MVTRGNSETNSSGPRRIRATSQLLTQSTCLECNVINVWQKLTKQQVSRQNRFQRSKVSSLLGKREIDRDSVYVITLVEKLKTLEEHYEGNANWVMLMMF